VAGLAKKLTTRQVKAILQGEKADSLSSSSASKLSTARETALNYYLGDMTDLPPAEGSSKAISTDVSDVVDGLMPGLMEVFCGSDEVVRFDPVGPEDMAAAEQETEVVNHVFMQKNPGFNILQAMFKDALLSKTGIVKVWWEEKEEEEEETYYDQDEEALMMLVSKPDFEVVAHTANEDGTHDVTLQKIKGYGCAKVMNVPPEEFGVARRTRRLQDTPYCFHEPGGGRPESELIAEGFDAEQVKKLSTWSETRSRGTEAKARDTVDENSGSGAGDSLSRGQRPVQITEHYLVFDYEGKGKACRYQIITGGDEGEILNKNGKPAIQKHSYVPFAVCHPDPMPHRFFGRSIADKTIETQRVKTVLTRGVLDNIYQINNQQMEVNEQFASDSTIDDLLNKKIGGIVRTKGPGAVNPIQVLPIADKLFPALEYFDREREWRTGVTREGQGLDATSLQNQSATAARQLFSASQAKMKLIARNLVVGVGDLFWLLHSVMRAHSSKPETIKLRNEWVSVDPRMWRERNDMTVTVGLGDGGKQEQMAGLQVLIQAQMQAAENPALGLITPKNFYNSAKEMVKLLDKRDVSLFFTDPGDAPMPEPPPPPEIQKAQIEGQMRSQEIQMKAGIEKLQAEADIVTNQKKVEADIMLNREKNAQDMAFKQQEHAMKMEEMRMKLLGQAASASIKQESDQAMAHQKLVGTAQQSAMKMATSGGKEGEGAKPNMELIEKIMASANGGAQPKGPSKKRMKKVGPGEWEVSTE
jgi:hypothetical protein